MVSPAGERQRRWRAANPDKVRTYARAWRDRNPDYARKWRLANPDKVKEYSAYGSRWVAANPDKVQRAKRKHKYGITPEQYDELVVSQTGRCRICEEGVELVIDHDHTTGRVRGLLCGTCNSGLGMFRDRPDILQKAIQYLAEA